ncbi:unnamed protein product [Dovyalis caffra]|uniref:Uncharacterized protein n=1 Tax=Dovyalis caffra TaxID=77055 RepID=A0AAV1QT43_9ROSI|nr:unnamed protein product [Dovyalis caffra]
MSRGSFQREDSLAKGRSEKSSLLLFLSCYTRPFVPRGDSGPIAALTGVSVSHLLFADDLSQSGHPLSPKPYSGLSRFSHILRPSGYGDWDRRSIHTVIWETICKPKRRVDLASQALGDGMKPAFSSRFGCWPPTPVSYGPTGSKLDISNKNGYGTLPLQLASCVE